MRALALVCCLLAGHARFLNAQTSPTASNSGLLFAPNGTSTKASTSKPTALPSVCLQCNLQALDPTTIAYSATDNVKNSTLITTATITPHYWVYDDGYTFSTSYETVTVTSFVPTTTNGPDGTQATVLAEDLTWHYKGVALTYPTKYVIYSHFNVQRECSQSETPLTVTQADVTKAIFPVATGGVKIGSDVIKLLQDLPDVRTRFNDTNLQTCGQEVERGGTDLFPVPGSSAVIEVALVTVVRETTPASRAGTEPTTKLRLPIPFGPRTAALQYPGSGTHTLYPRASGVSAAQSGGPRILGVESYNLGSIDPLKGDFFSHKSPDLAAAQTSLLHGLVSITLAAGGNSGAGAVIHTTVAVLTEATAEPQTTIVTRGTDRPHNYQVVSKPPAATPPGNSAEPTRISSIPGTYQSPQPDPNSNTVAQTNPGPNPPGPSQTPGGVASSMLSPPEAPESTKSNPTLGGSSLDNGPTNNKPSDDNPTSNSPNDGNLSNRIHPPSSPGSSTPGTNIPHLEQSITIGAGPPVVIRPLPSSQSSDQPGVILSPSLTLLPGQSAIVNDAPVVLQPSDSSSVVRGSINPLGALAAGAAITLGPALLTIGTVVYALTSSGGAMGFIVAPGTMLSSGGSLVVSGITYSLPAVATSVDGPSIVVINGRTSTFKASPASPYAGRITAAPTLTIDSTTYAPMVNSGRTYYVIASGATLEPGGVVTVHRTRVSLGPEGTALVIGGVTSIALRPTSTTVITNEDVGYFVASGMGISSAAGAESLSERGAIEKLMDEVMLGAVGVLMWVL